jgi:hypothetical protein
MGAKDLAKRLLAGQPVFVRGLTSKAGNTFDRHIVIDHREYNGTKYIGLTFADHSVRKAA